MLAAHGDLGLRIFSTCPPSDVSTPDAYLRQVQLTARWSEAAGCEGILVYTDNARVDPWLTAQVILEATCTLCPLVAIQPVYMHPYSAAKMITTLAFLHGRRVYLNMVAGGFTNDLAALADRTPHDERYARLVEYTAIIQGLLQTAGPFSFSGRYYQVDKLRLTPPLPPELLPGVLVSGSSEAGMQAALRLGATPIEYPKPAAESGQAPAAGATARGLRIGLIARATEAEAWRDAHARFPPDRKGQLTHELAMKVSDSSWHQQLSKLGAKCATEQERNPYWLVPFQNYKTFCPYLVGSYATVAQGIADYVNAGFRTFVLDVPTSPEELRDIGLVFGIVRDRVAA
jgi:alkanesulfonate monooxygenase